MINKKIILLIILSLTLTGCSSAIEETSTQETGLTSSIDFEQESETIYYRDYTEEITRVLSEIIELKQMIANLNLTEETTESIETQEQIIEEEIQERIEAIESIEEDLDLLQIRTIEIENSLDDLQNKLKQIIIAQNTIEDNKSIVLDNTGESESKKVEETEEEKTPEETLTFSEVFAMDTISITNAQLGKTYGYKIALYCEGLEYTIMNDSVDVDVAFFLDEAMTIPEIIESNRTIENIDGCLYITLIPKQTGQLLVQIESVDVE